MALPLSSTASGGTNGTTVTTANSGGASGNAFDNVVITATGSLIFSSSHFPHGTLSYAVTTGTTAGPVYMGWGSASVGTHGTVYGRAYMYVSAMPAADDGVIGFYSGSGAYIGAIMVSTGSPAVFRLQGSGFTEVSSTFNVPVGSWFRVEWKIVPGVAGTGSATLNFYSSPDSATITGTLTDTTNAWGGAVTVDEMRIGWTGTHASQPTVYFADLNLNATGYPGPFATTHAGAAAMAGTGSLGGTWRFEGTAPLDGEGTMLAAGIGGLLGAAALDGEGTLTGAQTGAGAAALDGEGVLSGTAHVALYAGALDGEGTLGAARGVTWAAQAAALTGDGTLSLSVPSAALDGEGILGISGLVLGFTIGLSGTGTLSVPQVLGTLTAGSGGVSTSYALPGSSQVAVAPPGSSNWQWLGTAGQVTALTYSYVCPGGCDQMTATVMVPAAYRTQLFNPGWKVRITRGGHQVWSGIMDEPVPTPQGWTLTAVGTGNLGTNYVAAYTSTWPASEPDESINNAIGRGLPWVNPGVGSPAGMWLGQAVDSGSQTITGLLNLVCTRGGLTWYVNSQPGGAPGDDLSVFPLPAKVSRLLVCTTPVARTLGGDINKIFIRYEVSADNPTTGAAAAYSVTTTFNAASIAAHGPLETYIDLSSAGVMTAATAQAVASSVLQIYQRASFAGPFTASYGQLLNTGGTPVDPGTDQAGSVAQLILTDFGFGGEVVPFPITFIVGAYSWDDFAQVATITPYQTLNESLSGMLSMESTVKFSPVGVA